MATATATTPLPAAAPRHSETRPLPYAKLAALALMGAAFVPLVGTHLFQLWARPHYQFFPIVFLGAGVLAYLRFPGIASLRPGSPAVSACLFGFAWLLLAGAEILDSSMLGAVAALFMLLAVTYSAGGAALVRPMLPAWVFLWLIIPLPFGLDNALVLALQNITTQWSSALLNQFGVFHVIAGNVVEIGTRRLFVAEACAGINSLFSILACAVFYVLFTRTGPVRSALLILAACSWVLLANVLRVFLVAYLAKIWNIDVAEGWRHDAVGYALFAVALVLIWSSDRLLILLTPARWLKTATPDPSPAANDVDEKARLEASALLRKCGVNTWVVAGAFGLLLAVHVAFYSLDAAPTPVRDARPLDLAGLGKNSLPEKLDGWQFEKLEQESRGSENAFGEFSKIWTYRTETQPALISLDYPFPGWHELEVCYRNQGWEVTGKTDLAADKDENAPAFYSERKLKKTGMRFAQLFFCQFDQAGQAVEAEQGGLSATLRRHESALNRLFAWKHPETAPMRRTQTGSVYQFQLLVESDTPLDPTEWTAARTRFFKAHQSLRQRLFGD